MHLLTAYTGNSTIIQSKYTNEYGATIGNLLYNYELKWYIFIKINFFFIIVFVLSKRNVPKAERSEFNKTINQEERKKRETQESNESDDSLSVNEINSDSLKERMYKTFIKHSFINICIYFIKIFFKNKQVTYTAHSPHIYMHDLEENKYL